MLMWGVRTNLKSNLSLAFNFGSVSDYQGLSMDPPPPNHVHNKLAVVESDMGVAVNA